MRDTYEQFKYQNIMTEDLVRFFSAELKQDMTPIFDQYLRRTALPVLELTFDEAAKTVAYRWKADERGFAMPIKVGDPAKWQLIQPTTDWKSMEWSCGQGRVQGRDRSVLRERPDPRRERRVSSRSRSR